MEPSTDGSDCFGPNSSAGRGLLWVIVLAAAVLIGAIVLVQSGSGAGEYSRSAGLASTRGPSPTRSPHSAAPDVGVREELADPNEPELRSSAELERAVGSFLDVLVLDDATGRPLPGIELSLFSERPLTAGFGYGVTDRAGRAQFLGLSENLYLVASRRTAPHAEGLGVVWVSDRSQQELVIRLTAGGSIAGRVVDDLGKPLEGAEIKVVDGTGFSSSVIRNRSLSVQTGPTVVSDRDGRFRIDAVRSEPKGVWLIGDEVRQERFASVRIEAELQGGRAAVSCPVKEGQTSKIEDLVIERSRSMSGVVVDEQGTPVPDVIVSVSKDRIWVAQNESNPNFNPVLSQRMQDPHSLIENEEALTDELGRFELHSRTRAFVALLRGRSGSYQLEELPPVAAGESVTDIRLVLQSSTPLSLRLLNEEGRPVASVPNPKGSHLQYSANFFISKQVRFLLAPQECSLDSNSTLDDRVLFNQDGLYSPSFESSIKAASELLVFCDGYHMARVADLPQALASPITLELKPLPSIRLRLSLSEDWPRSQIYRLRKTLEIIASSISPSQLPDSATTLSIRKPGLGSKLALPLGTQAELLTLPVQRDGEYWIYLVPGWQRDGEPFQSHQVAGPYSSSSREIHEIELTPDFLAQLAIESEGILPKHAPGANLDPLDPSALLSNTSRSESESGQVDLRLTDAKSGEPITKQLVYLSPDGGRSLRLMPSPIEPGLHQAVDLGPGTWRPILRQQDYESIEWDEFELQPGERRDLGSKQLVPRPRLKGLLLLADGSPATERAGIVLLRVEDEDVPSTYGQTNGDGYFDVPFTTQEFAHLFIRTQSPRQQFCLDPTNWNGEIQLKPWRSVEFVLDGIDNDKQYEASDLGVTPAHCDIHTHPEFEGLWQRNSQPQLDGRRRFRLGLATGSYTPSMRGGTIAVMPTPFEVFDGAGVQQVRLELQQ